eukprot:CAMPEP_0204271556 /NCGR_PEP_ID=MMETSP0468-20130131/20294_1 /ASSEMBLY_ACC=CAM_ASM_000383 /TAXON_ID=2969 /ORGANISM="Oxyrrhis marina" /LENGTH=154 /DNA_ID=CAMNT_0051247253 /DNA_START=85 /DNA_END=549 /DNA_ORIENTATION=+
MIDSLSTLRPDVPQWMVGPLFTSFSAVVVLVGLVLCAMAVTSTRRQPEKPGSRKRVKRAATKDKETGVEIAPKPKRARRSRRLSQLASFLIGDEEEDEESLSDSEDAHTLDDEAWRVPEHALFIGDRQTAQEGDREDPFELDDAVWHAPEVCTA